MGSLFGILVQGEVQISARGPSGADVILCTQSRGFYFGEAAIVGNTATTATIVALDDCTVFGLSSRELQQLTIQMPLVKESLLQTVSYRLKQNLLAIPFFAQLKSQLENKKHFKVLGALDLLSTMFEVEALDAKTAIFNAGDPANKLYVICEGCVRISSKDHEGHDFMLSMLKKNDIFGEIALLEHTKRTASARAFEPVLLLSITKEKFDRLFKVFPDFQGIMKPLLAHRTANTLKKVNVFTNLSKDKQEILGGMLEFCDFEPGDIIEEEGSFDCSLYIVVAGSVQATSVNRETGEIQLLSVMEEGTVMGEMALLTGSARSANLIALESTQCLRLSAEQYRRFLSFAPEVMDDLVNTAQERRSSSIKMNAENSISIPDIDHDVNSKLYLYSLLRNNHDLEIEDGGDLKSSSVAMVESLAVCNEDLKELNVRKRTRVKELQTRIVELKSLLENNGLDIDKDLDFHDREKIRKIEQTMNSNINANAEDNANRKGNGSIAQLDVMKRRNSWTSNTQVEQYKEDILRVLQATFVDGMVSPIAKSTCRGENPVSRKKRLSAGELNRRKREASETISIHLEDENEKAVRADSPTKKLGQQFTDFSAVASSRHVIEETLEQMASRPGTAEKAENSHSHSGRRSSREKVVNQVYNGNN